MEQKHTNECQKFSYEISCLTEDQMIDDVKSVDMIFNLMENRIDLLENT